jgi:hypothetical protein
MMPRSVRTDTIRFERAQMKHNSFSPALPLALLLGGTLLLIHVIKNFIAGP